MSMAPSELANSMYALGVAFQQSALIHPRWGTSSRREAKVGDMVLIDLTLGRRPIGVVGKLVVDEWVLIRDWGPVENWDPRDQEDYRNGKRVGQQREWEIECFDGTRRRYTDVMVFRLPDRGDVQ